MSFTTTYNPESGFIETKILGKLSLGEAKEIITAIIQVAKENDCFLCLSDYREAEIGLSTLEIYDVPEILAEISASQGLPAKKFKRAILMKKGASNFRFLETVTVNSGQTVRLFQDLDKAREWLSKE